MLKDLKSAKFVPHIVNIGKLKCPSNYRGLQEIQEGLNEDNKSVIMLYYITSLPFKMLGE